MVFIFLHGAFALAWSGDCYQKVFEHKATEHSMVNAYLSMYASTYCYDFKLGVSTYDDFKEKFRRVFSMYGFKNFEFINEREKTADTQAVIMSNDQMVMLVFRGSETRKWKERDGRGIHDWILTDLNVFKKKIKSWGRKVKVHRGFYTALDIVYSDIKSKCKRHMKHGNKPLWIAGHSLGAALATLAAFRFERDGIPVQGTMTFGSPRVGNKHFVEEFQKTVKRFHRWVNCKDIVTMVPPRVLFYKHVSSPHMLYSDGTMALNDEERNGIGKFKDHMFTPYLTNLFKHIPKKIRETLPKPPNYEEESYAEETTTTGNNYGSGASVDEASENYKDKPMKKTIELKRLEER